MWYNSAADDYTDDQIAINNAYNDAAAAAWAQLNAAIHDPNCGFFCISAAFDTYNTAIANAEAARDQAMDHAEQNYWQDIQAADDWYEECVANCDTGIA